MSHMRSYFDPITFSMSNRANVGQSKRVEEHVVVPIKTNHAATNYH
jgi:hypothetical protein